MASLHNENNTKDGVGQLGRFMIARDVEDPHRNTRRNTDEYTEVNL